MYSEPAESVNYDEHLGVRRVSENKQQHAKLPKYKFYKCRFKVILTNKYTETKLS